MLKSVLAIVLALHQAPPGHPRIVVERARVGPVSIGAAADAVYREFRDRARLVDLKLEGHAVSGARAEAVRRAAVRQPDR